jgi:hypothetical protein
VPPGHLLSILKKEIKEKFNIGKITFYIFKELNTQDVACYFGGAPVASLQCHP